MLYFAPLQGFTDSIYRQVYARHFSGIDVFFTPYISVKNGKVSQKQLNEILPENDTIGKTIPQVLVKDGDELLLLAEKLDDLGYNEINLNMGCPYPMVTNRGKGAGLLPHPPTIEKMLDDFFRKTEMQLSIKLRAGLISTEEFEKILPVLNAFPLKELIYHPRVATQLYKGEIDEQAFEYAVKNCKHPLVYNGDIISLEDFREKKNRFPGTERWMMGRGILMNPFLPAEIRGEEFSVDEKRSKLSEFHEAVLQGYNQQMDNPGNTLNKMKQFWIYFSFSYKEQKKAFKTIKKCRSIDRFLAESKLITNSFELI